VMEQKSVELSAERSVYKSASQKEKNWDRN
jgi:hypothetical protein